MRCRLMTVAAVAAGLMIVSVPLVAHHSTINFDAGKEITMEGTVTEWVWANPHCFLIFDVPDDNGGVVHWIAEGSNPPGMARRGWSDQSLKPGDEITVTVEPVKNGRPLGRILQVVLPNGQTVGDQGAGNVATPPSR